MYWEYGIGLYTLIDYSNRKYCCCFFCALISYLAPRRPAYSPPTSQTETSWAFESPSYSDCEAYKNNYSLSEAQLNTHLIKVRVGLRLAYSVEIWDIDELKVKEKSRVFYAVFWPSVDMREVAKLRVPPVIQITQTTTNKIYSD